MTVRWGVLGAGWIAKQAMLSAIGQAPGAECVAIASRDGRRARPLAKRHGVDRVYKAYDDLLADPGVDAVYVALANDAHAPWTVRALEAGKHVLCEKPLALNAAEVDAMAAAAERAGRLLVEAAWYRWHPRTRLVERLLRNELDVLGPVSWLTAGFTFDGVPAGNYRLDPAKGGGALYDVGWYPVSAALWAFGTAPREVSAKAEIGPTGVDLATEVVVTFDGGDAVLRCGIAEPDRQYLVLRTRRGEVSFDVAPFTAWEGQETRLVFHLAEGTPDETVAPANAYALMVENVSAVIEGRDGWVPPLADSRAIASVIDAAFASIRTGAPVRV